MTRFGAGDRAWRRRPPAAALALLAACAGPASDPAPAGPGPMVVVSAPANPGEAAAQAWWESILGQCREAARAGDLERLAGLVAGAGGREGPAWAKESLARFGALLRAERLIAEEKIQAFFVLPRRDFAAGETVWLRLRLANRTDAPALLPGPGGEGLVRARMILKERNLLGESWERREDLNLPLPRPFRLGPGEAVEAGFDPFTASLPSGTVMREIRLEGSLIVGRIVAGREELPLKDLAVKPTEFRVFPKGFLPIRNEPLITLRNALALGDEPHLPHVFLAAAFLAGAPAAARVEAVELLVGALRDGAGRLPKVAAAALREMTGLDLPGDDPQEWPAGWRERALKAP